MVINQKSERQDGGSSLQGRRWILLGAVLWQGAMSDDGHVLMFSSGPMSLGHGGDTRLNMQQIYQRTWQNPGMDRETVVDPRASPSPHTAFIG
jgi:hypothetical protein